MSQRGSTTEPSFNEVLGTALRRSVVRWRKSPDFVQVERTRTIAGAPGKHPDVLIADPEMWPVAIEASFDGRDADRDASARLGLETAASGVEIETAVAVRIPESCRKWSRSRIAHELGEGAEIAYAVHQRAGEGASQRWPRSGFALGAVADLVDLLPLVASPKEVVDETADYVAQRVQWAAARLHDPSTPSQRERLAADVHQRTVLKGFATTMVVWLNALLTQARLHERHEHVPAPTDCCDESGYPLPDDFVKAWREILNENWRSVFEPATSAMTRAAAVNASATSQALRCLLEAVQRIKARRLAHINVGAELFPKLSDDRKTAAAYYTQPPAAEFLAAMTVTPESLPSSASWTESTLWEHAKLADLACGTGTLLRAAYRRIAALHQRSGAATPDSMTRLHKAAMETGIYGTDISPVAAHLTASSLAALGDGNPYGVTHVGWVRVGGTPAKAGALEYLEAEEMDDLFGTAGERSAGVEEEHPSSVYVGDDSLCWVLMNPPYSRTRGGQSAFDVAGASDDERRACQRRWRELARGKSNNQAGMAASFLALADQKLSPGGRLGFVLPLTAAFADSWTMTRKLVETGYDDIVAIAFSAGRALGREAVSADTGMEEMMLVATKRASARPSAAVVRCVTLYEPLRDAGQAHEIARAVGRAVEEMGPGHLPVRVGDQEVGRVVAFEADGSGKPWTPVATRSVLLPGFASALGQGRFRDLAGPRVAVISVVFGSLEDLFEIGPTHDLIGYPVGGDGRGAFEFHPLPPGASLVGDRALWAADSRRQQQMQVRPTHKGIVPRALADRDQDRMRAQTATLFYARNLRWTSQSLLAAATDVPVMGGRSWTALEHADEHVLKAFALWANSTLGSLLHWSVGQRTQAGRSTTQIGALRRIPVPLLDRLDAPALDIAAREFDKIKTKLLRPLCQAHADPVRKEIDQAVVRMLALPPWADEVVAKVRDLWCREPSVHGNNRAALALLDLRDRL